VADKRRSELLNLLRSSHISIKGGDLAKHFNVSRQIIVQDIALLRAEGHHIISSPTGYEVVDSGKILKRIKCNDKGYDEIKDELEIIIDMGGSVLDVIVVHSTYGEISCPIGITSRYEMNKFLDEFTHNSDKTLSSLTNGDHIHTIEVPSEEIYSLIIGKLKEKGYLVET